jgi:hypothetical protein
MLRRLFTLLSTLSLVVCVGTGALWVRSYGRTPDAVEFSAGRRPMAGGLRAGRVPLRQPAAGRRGPGEQPTPGVRGRRRNAARQLPLLAEAEADEAEDARHKRLVETWPERLPWTPGSEAWLLAAVNGLSAAVSERFGERSNVRGDDVRRLSGGVGSGASPGGGAGIHPRHPADRPIQPAAPVGGVGECRTACCIAGYDRVWTAPQAQAACDAALPQLRVRPPRHTREVPGVRGGAEKYSQFKLTHSPILR